MNILNNKKARDLQKPVPGCMGRMINIFDLSGGMAGTKLLTEKPHKNGDHPTTGLKKVSEPFGGQMEDKPVTHPSKQSAMNKKSNGTPVKMLMSQELFKEKETPQKQPSVIAKLMGLDALPAKKLNPTLRRAMPEDAMRDTCTIGKVIHGYGKQANIHSERMLSHKFQPSHVRADEHRVYRDVYEVHQNLSKAKNFKDGPLTKRVYKANANEKKLTLVRQMFMEAKRLAMSEDLLQSKEFQDALEVLSLNHDLFLKFLEEPSSLFSKRFQDLQTAPSQVQNKCITVLKPSKALSKGNEELMKNDHLSAEVTGWHKNDHGQNSGCFHQKTNSSSQPTRIVVLKPNPGKHYDVEDEGAFPCTSQRLPESHYDMKDEGAFPSTSQRLSEKDNMYEGLGSDEVRWSREMAKEITQQMGASFFVNRRDESLLSSVLSNGYTGDESSFGRSENSDREEECSYTCDSQAMTPVSRHSRDCIDRFESPFSLSPFSHTSYSPESSMIREAKKRLSERWVMGASRGTNQEQRQVRRNSSTLGEMLTVPERWKGERRHEARSKSSGGKDLEVASSSSSSSKYQEENVGIKPSKCLHRSKSVLLSSSTFGNAEENVESLDSQTSKSTNSKDTNEQNIAKPSFKGKVSSLFFSRNKKSNPEDSSSSLLVSHDKVQPSDADSTVKRDGDVSQCAADVPEGPLHNYEKVLRKNLAAERDNLELGTPCKETPPLEKCRASESASENLEQPSPVSVLDVLFDEEEEEDENSTPSLPCETSNLECHRLGSKIPLIESVAPLSLSWDEIYSKETTTSTNLADFVEEDAKEQEWIIFVRALLSSSRFGIETSQAIKSEWHSLESPLNPALLDKFLEPKVEGEKSRERRSNQRLLFDCVNVALLDIFRTDVLDIRLRSMAHFKVLNGKPVSTCVMEQVLEHIKEWFSNGNKCSCRHSENNSIMVDYIIRKETCGKEWEESMRMEIAEMGREIEGHLLDELVGETVDGYISERLQ